MSSISGLVAVLMVFQSQLDQPIEQGAIRESGRGGRLRIEAGGGHAGDGVGLLYKYVALDQDHVGAAVTPATERLLRGQGVALGLYG